MRTVKHILIVLTLLLVVVGNVVSQISIGSTDNFGSVRIGDKEIPYTKFKSNEGGQISSNAGHWISDKTIYMTSDNKIMKGDKQLTWAEMVKEFGSRNLEKILRRPESKIITKLADTIRVSEINSRPESGGFEKIGGVIIADATLLKQPILLKNVDVTHDLVIKIKNPNPVMVLSGVTVTGSLTIDGDCSGIELRAHNIKCGRDLSIRATGVENLYMINCATKGDIRFDSMKFNNVVVLQGRIEAEYVRFRDCVFGDSLTMSGCGIEGRMMFNNCEFNSLIDLSNLKLANSMSIVGGEQKERLVLDKAMINDTLTLEECVFRKDVDLATLESVKLILLKFGSKEETGVPLIVNPWDLAYGRILFVIEPKESLREYYKERVTRLYLGASKHFIDIGASSELSDVRSKYREWLGQYDPSWVTCMDKWLLGYGSRQWLYLIICGIAIPFILSILWALGSKGNVEVIKQYYKTSTSINNLAMGLLRFLYVFTVLYRLRIDDEWFVSDNSRMFVCVHVFLWAVGKGSIGLIVYQSSHSSEILEWMKTLV